MNNHHYIFMKNIRKTLISIIGATCAVAVLTIGSFSFMSDSSKEIIDSGTVGTLKAVSDLKLKTTDGQQEGKTLTNLNPGDIVNISLDVNNLGNKSLSTRSSLYVVWNEEDFNKYSNHEKSLLLYNNFVTDEQIKEDMLVGQGKEQLNINTENVSEFSFKNQKLMGYKINLPEVKLNGVGNDAEIDVNEGNYPSEFKSDSTHTNGTYSLKLGFSNYANVHTMNKSFKVIAVTEGLQNRNTNSNDWTIINIDEITV